MHGVDILFICEKQNLLKQRYNFENEEDEIEKCIKFENIINISKIGHKNKDFL